MDNKEYLRTKAFEGLIKRGCIQPIGDARGNHFFFREQDQPYIDRLEEELSVINDFDFEDFILDVSYLSLLCKSKDILLNPAFLALCTASVTCFAQCLRLILFKILSLNNSFYFIKRKFNFG